VMIKMLTAKDWPVFHSTVRLWWVMVIGATGLAARLRRWCRWCRWKGIMPSASILTCAH
jgi:hypothetical protein